MFCPRCGTDNLDEASACVRCNYNFDEIPVFLRGKSVKYNENDSLIQLEKTEMISSKVNKKTEKESIKDHFLYALITTILCSSVLGAVAIVFSGFTKTEKTLGNTDRALGYSNKAKLLCNIALTVGIIKYLFVIAMVILTSFGIKIFVC